jgi:hypothetical protein
MDWGSGIPGVGGEPWEVGRGRWAVGSADSGADGHRLTDRGLRFIPERAREWVGVWLRVVACGCVRGRAPRAFIAWPSSTLPPAVSERVDKALAGGGGGQPPVRHVDPAALALLGLLSLRCLCAAEVAARLSPLHSPFD